ncbi:hypothetical protein NSERUTF1_0786 [Nocardia seriolae]|nr:hypothetical protein NSERUTF1_0786 [Nocardia seriolae]
MYRPGPAIRRHGRSAGGHDQTARECRRDHRRHQHSAASPSIPSRFPAHRHPCSD